MWREIALCDVSISTSNIYTGRLRKLFKILTVTLESP